jgi:transcriptional regulator with XRE-family HTH domain
MRQNNQITLGSKIKYFRKRAKMSQLQLENEIGAAAGSISRIENGEVNPTKETLKKIHKKLKLTSREYRYLDGDLAKPADMDEINGAKKLVREKFLRKGTFAYLIDDRARVWFASSSFEKVMGIDPKSSNKNYESKSILEILINPKLGIRSKIDKNKYVEILENMLYRYWVKIHPMEIDPSHQQDLLFLKQYPLAWSIWKTIVQDNKVRSYLSSQQREIFFKIYGVNFSMHYSVEPLPELDRFDIVEYIPNNIVLKLLSKL